VSGVFLTTPSVRTLTCVLADSFLIAGTFWLALVIRFGNLTPDYEGAWLKGAISVVALLISFYYNELYSGRAPRSVTILALRVLQAFLLAGVVLVPTVFYFGPDELELGRGILLIHVPIALAALVVWRTFYYWVLQQESFVENVLILGTGSAAVGLARELLGHRSEGFRVVGFLSREPADVGKSLFNPSVVGTYDDLLQTAERFNVHSVVVALDDQRGVLPLSELLTCKLRGINVAQSAEFYESLTGQLPVRNLRPSSIIFSQGFRKPRFFMTTRRIMETVLAGVGLLVTAPVMALSAVAIVLESGFPILYRQERVGQHGRTFTLLKLRTMRQDAEQNGAVWAAAGGDPRITRVGNFLRKMRIDEFPQLWNVFKGEMSFVGPRPERPVFVEELQAQIPYYGERHSVKPGITGWAQVRHGYTSTIEESEAKLRYDLYYIKNMSFWLDLQIVLDTFKVIAFGRGAR
jgi:sugar transferase (PEP-CTERM system associated)